MGCTTDMFGLGTWKINERTTEAGVGVGMKDLHAFFVSHRRSFYGHRLCPKLKDFF